MVVYFHFSTLYVPRHLLTTSPSFCLEWPVKELFASTLLTLLLCHSGDHPVPRRPLPPEHRRRPPAGGRELGWRPAKHYGTNDRGYPAAEGREADVT